MQRITEETMKTCLWLLVLCCLGAACAKAPTNDSTTPHEPRRINSVDVVKATPEETTIAAGESGEVPVTLQITNGYHINANPPTFPYLKATELELKPTEGISVEFIRYPNPLVKQFPFAEKPLAVYEGQTVLKARLKADKTASSGKHNLSAKLSVQACDDQVCYAPGVLDVLVPVNIK